MGMFTVVAANDFVNALKAKKPSDVDVNVVHVGEDGIQIQVRQTPIGLDKKSSYIGSVELHLMSGTVAVSRELFIAEKHRRKGYSGTMEVFKIIACTLAGITMMVATVKHTNNKEIKAIMKHGWQRMAKLDSEDLWGKILNNTPTYLSFLEKIR